MAGGAASSGAILAGQAFVRLFADRTDLEAGLKAAERRLAAFGRNTARAGSVLFAGAGGAALTFGKLAEDTLGDLSRIGEIAKAFGTPVEELSGLFGVMKAAGSPLKESIESISQFGTAITNAVEGKGENAQELFTILNRNAADFKKLNIAQAVYEMYKSLEAVSDPLEKNRAASLAFGTDGMKLLQPMLNKTNAELKEQARLYAVSKDETDAANKASVAYTEATAKLGRAWDKIVLAVAPTLTQVADWTSEAAVATGDFAKANETLVTWMGAGTVGAAALGAAMVGTGVAASYAATACGAFATAVGAATSPVGLTAAAVAGLGYVFATETEAGQRFVSYLGGGFTELKGIAEETFAGINGAAAKGDWEEAGKIAMAGLKVVWLQGTAELTRVWNDFNTNFLDQFRDAAIGVEKIYAIVVAELKTKFAELRSEIDAVVRKAVGLASVLSPLGTAGVAKLYELAAEHGPSRAQAEAFAKGAALGAAKGMLGGSLLDVGQTAAELGNDPKVDQQRRIDRANAGLGAAIALNAAKAELTRLSERAQFGDWGGGSFDKDDLPKGLGGSLKGLAGVIGTQLGGANALQVFGGGGNIPQQQLDGIRSLVDTSKKTMATQDEILDVLEERLNQPRFG